MTGIAETFIPTRSATKMAQNAQWIEVLENRHIIAALRNVEAVPAVLSAPTEVVYLLFGNPLNIRELVQAMRG